MKRTIYIFCMVLFLLMAVPPLVVEIVYGKFMVFIPYLFMNKWFSFVSSTVGLLISFVLIYVIWERRRNREISLVDCKILIFHLDSYLKSVQKCITLINEFPGNGQSSEDVNKIIREEIKELDSLPVVISILKSGSYKNYNSEFALTLEEIGDKEISLVQEIKDIMIFTSKDSKGLNLLSSLYTFLKNHKEQLEGQYA